MHQMQHRYEVEITRLLQMWTKNHQKDSKLIFMLQPGVHDQRAESYKKKFRNFMVQELNEIASKLIIQQNGKFLFAILFYAVKI